MLTRYFRVMHFLITWMVAP